MRKYFKITMLLIGINVLSACTDSQNMNLLSVGMTKKEVIEAMGRDPDSSSAQGGFEYLSYSLWRGFWDRRPGSYSDRFFVRLVDGKVESYGKVGDFDSTKIPETRSKIDLHINH